MLRGRAFGPLWERRGANGEPTLPGFSPFLNFPPSGQGNPDLEIPGESFADKFRTMERFQAEVRPLVPAS